MQLSNNKKMAQNVTLLQLNIMIVIIIKIMTLIMIMIFSAWYTLQTLPTGAQQRQRETLCRWQDVKTNHLQSC